MRTFRHWTPRYVNNRIRTLYYEKACPDHPWLTRSANEILDSWLMKSDIGLEFGSGRSTPWFASRIRHLTSVEHEPEWGGRVRQMLLRDGISNVDYRVLPRDAEENSEKARNAKYVQIIDSFDNNSLDFCLVDGAYREYCALRVIRKIRPSGVLVIDNVNRYLPSASNSPHSRSLAIGPKGPVWKEVETLLSDWRRIWTSSGVTDTALFFKPCT